MGLSRQKHKLTSTLWILQDWSRLLVRPWEDNASSKAKYFPTCFCETVKQNRPQAYQKKFHLLALLIKMGEQLNIVYRKATNSFITMWFANSPWSLALLELKCFQLNSK